MGKKKKKDKREESNDGVEASAEDVHLTAELAKEAKKSKRKKKEFSDDYDDDLTTLASEMGLGGAGKGDDESPEGHEAQKSPPTSTLPESSGAVAVPESPTLETPTGNLPQTKSAKVSKKKKKKAAQQLEGETAVGEGGTSKPSGEAASFSPSTPEEHGGGEKDSSEVTTAATALEEGKDETSAVADDEDKKKKKKKKKKPSEEEKKPKGPSKGALSKIKRMQAALEEEKKRREQEASIAQREEEERERAREEKERLEQERKEKLKQKEKEKKERRKKEGKPVTKKEREAEARRQAQLTALQEQGVVVPEKSVGEKKKILYGRRQRIKKENFGTAGGSGSVEMQQDQVKGEYLEAGFSGDQEGLESWEDLEEAEDEVVVEHQTTETGREKASEPVASSISDHAPKKDGASSESSSDEESSSSSSGGEEGGEEEVDLSPFAKAKLRIQKRRKRYASERSVDTLRSPVVCVLGHVDTGKTKILDKIRRTNVQEGEAGGITQQIGATFVPAEAISEQTKMLKEFSKKEWNLPGLLIIDTPGHESFRNLRMRGSSMCDLAILVVDIMHGLEPQTLESLSLLRKGKTPFIVALNKVDRLFDWHRNPNAGIRDTLKRQKPNTKTELEERVKQVSTEFAEQGLNVALFWEKVDFSEYVPMVPTSAITGDGMGDLIALLVEYSLKNLVELLMLSMELEAMVMEVKVLAGLGTTIDIILRNGVLKESDILILMGNEGPFVVTVRALLMPQPLKELRVKNAYISHSAVMAAQGVKVTAKGELEKTLPGTAVLVAKNQDEIDVLKAEAARAMTNVLNSIKMQERGVYVQSSTLGSLEALLEFLTQSKIPYSGISIGPVHKKDVMKASVMLEHDPQWAVILAFDVRVEREAQEMADSLNVKIFSADIIYHLFDAFLKHREELRERNRQQYQSVAVFPCKLRVLPNCIFNSRDPIVVGVLVEAGIVKPGTPLTVPSKNFTDIGVVTSLEVNHKAVDSCRKGVEVCVKIEAAGGEAPRLYGRHFDHTDLLVSKISRESIDAVKNYFREDLQKADWQLMIELKKTFEIM